MPTVESLKPDEGSGGRDPDVIRRYERLVSAVNDVKSRWAGPPPEADLSARLLLHKARMAVHSQEYADHVLPDDFLCPPGQWPNPHPRIYPRMTRGLDALDALEKEIGYKPYHILPPVAVEKDIVEIVRELRDKLVEVRIEQRLVGCRKYGTRELYDGVQIGLSALTKTQRATLAGYCRQKLLGTDADENDEELRKSYPKMSRFLTDVHRLCELLAADPIEVSAGPQEERQQTTADVIDEVERQLTQLGTGEAFCALLQADHALSAAKTKLLPAPAAAAGDSAVIEGIRARSRKRFSRSRDEVDAKTRRRRAIGTPGAQAAAPPRQETTAPPPSQARQPPQPEPPGEPPIGRR